MIVSGSRHHGSIRVLNTDWNAPGVFIYQCLIIYNCFTVSMNFELSCLSFSLFKQNPQFFLENSQHWCSAFTTSLSKEFHLFITLREYKLNYVGDHAFSYLKRRRTCSCPFYNNLSVFCIPCTDQWTGISTEGWWINLGWDTCPEQIAISWYLFL